MRRTSARPSPGGMALVLALAVALWAASTLGFMHRVVHAPGARSVILSAPSREAGLRDPHAHARAGVMALFGHHGSEDDCRLYDQLAGGFATLAVATLVLPIVLSTARFHFFLGEAIVRWVALFEARAPPAIR